MQGGKKYYLHLGYRKDGSVSSGNDKVTINSISIERSEKTEIEDYTNSTISKAESEYYFTRNNGKIIPNNTGVEASNACSYIKIDLSDKEGEYTLVANAEISSQSGGDYGYATVTEDVIAPSYNNATGRFIYISGNSNAQDYKTKLTGGKIYYLHLGYYKDKSIDTGNDKIIFNCIKIGNVVQTENVINIEAGKIISEKVNRNIATIYNKNGKLNINGGLIEVSAIDSYVKTIYNSEGIVTINEGTVSCKDWTGSKAIDNYKGSIILNGGKISSSSNGISNYGNITINNGNINASLGVENLNAGTVIINGGTIKGSWCGIENSEKGSVELNKGEIYGFYQSIENSGNFKIKNSIVKTEGYSSYSYRAYGIKNSGNMEIIGSKINSINSYGDENYGIQNNGTLQILHSEVTSKNLSTKRDTSIAINNSGKLILGENDGKIDVDSILVYGYKTGIQSSDGAEINFFDGSIKGEISISNSIKKLADNSEIDISEDEGIETAKLINNNQPVASIGEKVFYNIQEAIDSCNTEETTINLLRNVNLTEDKKLSISEEKNIIFDMNGYDIKSFTTFLENKGKAKIINSKEKTENPKISKLVTDYNNSYFEKQEDGTILTKNATYWSAARSYMKLDLSKYYGTVRLNLDAEQSAASSNHGCISITNSTISPDFNNNQGIFVDLLGNQAKKTYTKEIEGGNVYYLHFYYYKNSNTIYGDDSLKISNIFIDPAFKLSEIKINSGIGIDNIGELFVTERVELYNSYSETSKCINNQENAKLTFKGNLVARGNYDGATYNKCYGIYNSSVNSINIENAIMNSAIDASTMYAGYTYTYPIYNNGTGEINVKNILIKAEDNGVRNI